jgi:hypothetical protein
MVGTLGVFELSFKDAGGSTRLSARPSVVRADRPEQATQTVVEEAMTYRISYDDTVPVSIKKWRNADNGRTESFETEHEALNRARELLDDGDCRAVSVCDDCGTVLGGIRLQLKLGFTAE